MQYRPTLASYDTGSPNIVAHSEKDKSKKRSKKQHKIAQGAAPAAQQAQLFRNRQGLSRNLESQKIQIQV